MPAHSRHPPSPVVLLLFPVTLLLGSLFSIISPTARASRGHTATSSSPAGPLAPSLAANLHISESPVNYFARKNNIFNLYFVKIGWLWTTLAFFSLLLCQNAYRSSSSQTQQQTRSRRILQASLRYVLATSIWYLMTQWFFGPAIIDRSFVITGGKCEQVLNDVGKIGSEASPAAQLETMFSAVACKAAGGSWRGGHDISGHVFMLVLATALLTFEAIGVGAFVAPSVNSQANGETTRDRKPSDPAIPSTSEQLDIPGTMRTWSLRLVWGVVGLGWWMLFMTAIWFHTWLEKVRSYRDPRSAPAKSDIKRLTISLVDRLVSGTRSHISYLHPPKNINALERDYWYPGSMNICMIHCLYLFILSLYDRMHSFGATLHLEIAFAPNLSSCFTRHLQSFNLFSSLQGVHLQYASSKITRLAPLFHDGPDFRF